MLSYIVSIYAICPVPRAQRLEHLFIRADSPEEADNLARSVFFGDPERRRYTIQMSRASEMPREAAEEPAGTPDKAPPLQMGFLNTSAQSALVDAEKGEG